jgi:hypothetical protein
MEITAVYSENYMETNKHTLWANAEYFHIIESGT